MPEEAKAAVLTEPRKPLEIKSFPLTEISSKEILVKVEIASICGTDVHLWLGQRPELRFPLILGHETVGRIYDLGEQVTTDTLGNRLRKGDRVIWLASVPCLKCYYCVIEKDIALCLNRKIYGHTYPCTESPYLRGGYAEYIYLEPNSQILKIPDFLPLESVVPLACAGGTAIKGFEKVDVQQGDNVVVQGVGSLGLYAIALANQMGADKIIAIDSQDNRLDLATQFGANYIINIRELKDAKSRIRKVKELTEGIGADVVIECTGDPSTIPEGCEMVRFGGKYLVLGHGSDVGNTNLNPFWHITRRQITIYGSWAAEVRHLYKGIKLIEDTNLPWNKIISAKYPLEKANEALMATKNKIGIKNAIVP